MIDPPAKLDLSSQEDLGSILAQSGSQLCPATVPPFQESLCRIGDGVKMRGRRQNIDPCLLGKGNLLQ